ncbi:type I methionyl aminopeptidase [Acuticoccus sp. I52.16.1]|uniref:type I methionyl aminopeptidase n=1 Tax=Acuticoccus sp. I52.16.1 TaxID=2928472 RepID=UPI001FD4EB72|nr:type I methionyl aminopeptidase [Acuticoccus sp. I52.16.1]UOM34841.1 type I methionyl aminopeptidase [Acuticoccus sp. I52.16.1]
MVEFIDADVAPARNTGQVRIYGQDAFAAMHAAGALTARCLDELEDFIVPGTTTEAIDEYVMAFAEKHDVIPATLYYRGFRKASCTSVNHVVCHGIPVPKPLKEGDVLNVDVTFILDGWHGDSSRMYRVGQVRRAADRLLKVTLKALELGVAAARPGSTTGDIGHAIQTYVEGERCSVVREFCGHGVGRIFHDMPNILHYGRPGDGVRLQPGMIFTIEPMVNLGRPHVKVLSDGWTAVTRDRSLSAQYEHTVGITEDGCEIFTFSPHMLPVD